MTAQKTAYEDLDRVRRIVRRGCTHREVRELLLEALDLAAEDPGIRVRTTTKDRGVIVLTERGVCSTHFTCSDRRAVNNLRAGLRRIGVPVR